MLSQITCKETGFDFVFSKNNCKMPMCLCHATFQLSVTYLRELIPSNTCIYAEIRTDLQQSKNDKYQFDLSDKKFQNNFLKWLDMLTNKND